MATRMDRAVSRQICILFNVGALRELTDGQLLERFAAAGGEANDLAFAALVERHGAMVLRVCRSVLNHPQEAEDAFQATFLILVQKARSLWVRESIGPWLHQVAFRTASCARGAAARRSRHERRAAEMRTTVEEVPYESIGSEWEQLLHDEINRLPESYRIAIVHCDLEGETCEQVARRLGRPVGTVKCWRSRGRERLRNRLVRLGMASVVGPETLAAHVARAPVPIATVNQTVRAAVWASGKGTSAGVVSARVSLLIKTVLKEMLMNGLRMTTTAVFAMIVAVLGFGAAARVAAEDPAGPSTGDSRETPRARVELPGPQALPTPRSLGESLRPLSLSEAVELGLKNFESIREIRPDPRGAFGSRVVVIPRDVDVDPWPFQATLQARVRTIEQTYWALVQKHHQLAASERAAGLVAETIKRDQAELEIGRSTQADIAEGKQRLEGFERDRSRMTSEAIAAERELLDVISLSLPQDCRIVPTTVPTTRKIEPVWETCLAEMLSHQPDIVGQKALIGKAEGKSAAFMDPLVLAANLAEGIKPSPELLRELSHYREITHKTTHSLARCYLEVDANYKRFEKASRFRAEMHQRLDEQRSLYQERRSTIDRYLSLVNTYAFAVAQEGQFKVDYTISLLRLEEAKGTLLEKEGIRVAEAPGAATTDR